MIIDIITNDVPGGWLPEQLPQGLGGSEESIILFAEALVRAGHGVTIHHPRPDPRAAEERNGVAYMDRTRWRIDGHRDVLITYREWRLWWAQQAPPPGSLNIHWSVDAEPPWPHGALNRLHRYVCLTHWARSRQVWLPERLAQVIPYGIDLATLDANRREQEPGLALYCSSPDRGMETLLRDWAKIRAKRPELRLRCAYGWELFDRYTQGRPGAVAWRREMEQLFHQDGIEWLGKLGPAQIAQEYWRAQYWVHPLNRADSEMFCLNALKAKHCGAVPAVIPIGALAETAPPFIPYERWVKGSEEIVPDAGQPVPETLDWDAVVNRWWLPLFDSHGKEAA